MIRRLKSNQVYNCQECKRLGVKRKAVWRTEGTFREVMCDEHKHLVSDFQEEPLTEADYASHMKL